MIEGFPTSSSKTSSTSVGAVVTDAPSGGEDEMSEACAAAGVAASPATKTAISAAAANGKGRRHRATHEENLTTCPTCRSPMDMSLQRTRNRSGADPDGCARDWRSLREA